MSVLKPPRGFADGAPGATDRRGVCGLVAVTVFAAALIAARPVFAAEPGEKPNASEAFSPEIQRGIKSYWRGDFGTAADILKAAADGAGTIDGKDRAAAKLYWTLAWSQLLVSNLAHRLVVQLHNAMLLSKGGAEERAAHMRYIGETVSDPAESAYLYQMARIGKEYGALRAHDGIERREPRFVCDILFDLYANLPNVRGGAKESGARKAALCGF